jgi:hypothetical protein
MTDRPLRLHSARWILFNDATIPETAHIYATKAREQGEEGFGEMLRRWVHDACLRVRGHRTKGS